MINIQATIKIAAALIILCSTKLFGQLNLSYSSPQIYNVGTTITPLSPSVSGGTPLAAQTSQTLAGSSQGYVNGTGAGASFYLPTSVVTDAAGNVYVGDSENNVIRKITPDGQTTTFAGNGVAGSADGPLLSANFKHPSGLAIDASGNIYVSDQYNHKIRKIGVNGIVSTIAGTGTAGNINAFGTGASFNNPTGLVFDASGNLFVADYGNHKIRKISPDGNVTTFVGSGAAGFFNGNGTSAIFNGPMGIAIDASNNLYVADRLNYRIRKISPSADVTTLAGSGSSGSVNGTGVLASFNRPTGIAVDASGNLYVTDENNCQIRKISPLGDVTPFAGTAGSSGTVNGTGSVVTFNSPYAITIDKQGNLFVAQLLTHIIRKVVTTAYNIYPVLPAGLSFNNSTGVLSGTPTVGQSSRSYYVQAFNASYASNLATFSISVGSAPVGIQGSQDQNYITTYMPNVAGYSTETAVSAASLNKSSVQTDIQYFDGLGRPMQNVGVMGSPGGRDLVQPISYDAFGREDRRYLPYTATAATSNGSYKAMALTDQNSFYTSPGSGVWNAPGVVAIPDAAFSKAVLEASPLDRVLEQGAPGVPWQPLSGSIPGSGHTTKFEYGSSNVDAVKVWTVNSSGATVTGIYGTNSLYKNRVGDENGNSTWEYKDKEGRVISKVVEQPALTYLTTRYVYDDLGNLRYVLPPGANPEGINGFIESDAVFANYIYAYKYDERNRVIRKKIPGKGWQEMIYNPLDQLVFSQDAVQAQIAGSPYPYRSFIKYDGLGRIVMTGVEKDHTGTREVVQDYVNNVTTGFWETRDNSATNYHGYNNISCPWNTLNLQPELVNYYDDYAIPGIPNNQSASYTKMTRGLLTATKTKVLGSPDHFLWTINYYDDEGRIAKVWQQHYKGGTVATNSYDETTNTYSFKGQLLTSIRRHYVAGIEQLYALNEYTYDHAGRAKDIYQKTGVNASTPNAKVLLSRSNYNEIGQLYTKQLHSIDNGSTFLQSTQYSYNERGWIKTEVSPQFSYVLKYNDGTTPQFSGNIANQEWGATSTFPLPNVFTYTYDKLNRLTNATSSGISMSEALTYDVMGNIKSMSRDGGAAGTYNYTGNQLNSITTGPLATATNYVYDVNGNATTDGRAGVTLTYNHLNLPATVNKSGVLAMIYTWDAFGNKLRKQSNMESTSEYVNGIQYTAGAIDFLMTAEGRARKSGTDYIYEYDLKDHLGNTRYTFNKHPTLFQVQKLQEDNYYAFGLRKVAFGGTHRYLYNGKEFQSELGQYDYGARFYDPVIGRWNVTDPLAEMAPDLTPFRYCFNNPINYIDPFGLWESTRDGYDTQNHEDIARFLDFLTIENENLKNIPSSKQISKFIDGEMKTGGLGELSDGSKLAKGITIEGKKDFSGINRWVTNKPSFERFWHSVQGDLRPNMLDTRTLGHNIFWTTYAGGDNPKSYNGKDNYSYNPSSRIEQAAIKHDRFYDRLGINGLSGLFGEKRAIKADWTYVYENIAVGANASENPINRIRGYLLGVGLGAIALPKTIEAYMPTMVDSK